ncbi:MAG: glycoside hydrolase family 25 protein [Lachnospiraceae bacterium]|nr:glycoside hydrolase family 25 protein [Lachnospiraceae bacterium]MDE7238937.1 glycoside hydrolase family 25 protein [Lachnospiraceae bacterium]
MNKKYIDISYANTVTNWDLVRKNVDGVIIRVGYRGYSAGNIKEDAKFATNIKCAAACNIPIGAYFMSQAINNVEAEAEADYCYEKLKKYNIVLPVCYDSELSNPKGNGRADNLTIAQRTAICKAFCDRIQQHGMRAGVYASTSWFKSYLNVADLNDYILWVAQYNPKCTATHRVDMWQYTSRGSISGIAGNVDISECYIEFGSTVLAQPEQSADAKKNLYWITAGDVWTMEEAIAAKESFESKYPGIPLGIRRANLTDVEALG